MVMLLRTKEVAMLREYTGDLYREFKTSQILIADRTRAREALENAEEI